LEAVLEQPITESEAVSFRLSLQAIGAQNLPDAPTWGPLREGQRASVTVTGFQVFQRPCNVTGIRAMVHVRNSGLLTTPTSTETIAEATVSASYTIQ
jgi:hypothetical protein